MTDANEQQMILNRLATLERQMAVLADATASVAGRYPRTLYLVNDVSGRVDGRLIVNSLKEELTAAGQGFRQPETVPQGLR